eukprot:TRINITY_DN47247_c0_g1_i1.p1 TRINITY_DN47247_c0_g1~~TRINITY_DN47247_c0_g1_i1.p1  ORF type:complete len:600 (+),score=157.08 TRINITY_DN47247_c0_g1_i1:68-1867(+)
MSTAAAGQQHTLWYREVGSTLLSVIRFVVYSVYDAIEEKASDGGAGGAIPFFTFAAMSQALGLFCYQELRSRSVRNAFFVPMPPRSVQVGALHPEIPRPNIEAQVMGLIGEATCSSLLLGARGCGKSWLLRKATRRLLAETGGGVAYIAVRPRSTVNEFILQLAERMNFRFRRPTSWIVRFVVWLFEHQGDQSESSETSEFSDWHRLAGAVEQAAREIQSGTWRMFDWNRKGERGRVPTVVIDNLQNLCKDEDDDGDDLHKCSHMRFIVALVEWAAWCADRQVLRVVLTLPSTADFDYMQQVCPRLPALQTLELPVLDEEQVTQYLGQLDAADQAGDLIRNVDSPLDARKMWDAGMQIKMSWQEVRKQMRGQGRRVLRKYALDIWDECDDREDERRTARTWRLLLQLVDEHDESRRGVLPHNRRHLGAAAARVVEEMTRGAVLNVRMLSGETRINFAPLRYELRRFAKDGSDCDPPQRAKLEKRLDCLDPEWRCEWKMGSSEDMWTGRLPTGETMPLSGSPGMGPRLRSLDQRVRRLSNLNATSDTIALANDLATLDEQADIALQSMGLQAMRASRDSVAELAEMVTGSPPPGFARSAE